LSFRFDQRPLTGDEINSSAAAVSSSVGSRPNASRYADADERTKLGMRIIVQQTAGEGLCIAQNQVAVEQHQRLGATVVCVRRAQLSCMSGRSKASSSGYGRLRFEWM